MVLRAGQLVIAVLGIALVLRWGITRDPGWGETSSLHPVIWTVHWVPLAAGFLCLLLTFAMIALLNRE